MEKASKELLKEFVNSQKFTSTTDIMNSMKELFSDVIQQVMEAELEEKLANYQIEANKSEIKSVLASRGLSAEFADLLAIGDDIEAAQANIDAFDKLFKAAVKAEVEKRLSGTAPKGNTSTSQAMTKEASAALTIAEQTRLLKSNPKFYEQFLN